MIKGWEGGGPDRNQLSPRELHFPQAKETPWRTKLLPTQRALGSWRLSEATRLKPLAGCWKGGPAAERPLSSPLSQHLCSDTGGAIPYRRSLESSWLIVNFLSCWPYSMTKSDGGKEWYEFYTATPATSLRRSGGQEHPPQN